MCLQTLQCKVSTWLEQLFVSLQPDYADLGEAIKTINTMDLESFGSPAKLTEKLGQITGPVVGKLISKILEHHQIIQGKFLSAIVFKFGSQFVQFVWSRFEHLKVLFRILSSLIEIETNLHLQSKRKELLEKKVKAFKGKYRSRFISSVRNSNF